jgi:HEAT repeat protein
MDEVHALRRAAAATDASAVPELRRIALTAESAVAATLAIAALSRRHAVAGDRDLVALTADPRQGVRQELVLALGASGDGRCVPLLRNLALGQDAAVRPLAIQALGRLGGAAALAALRELAQRGGLSVTDAAFVRQALLTANAGGELPMVPQGTRLLPAPAGLLAGDKLDEFVLPR